MAKNNGANLGFEQKLWQSADKLRNNMDAAEYKHVVLGLIFLKYISDAFLEVHEGLEADEYADSEDKDEYIALNVFPSQIESVLMDIGSVEPHYQLIVTREGNLDNLEVQIELSDELFSDRISNLEELERVIKHKIHSVLQINTKIRFVEPKSIPRSEGKAQRVIDKRNI